MNIKKLAAALFATNGRPPHARTKPEDLMGPDGGWKLRNSGYEVASDLYEASQEIAKEPAAGRARYKIVDGMSRAVENIIDDAAGLGIDLFAELAERAGLEDDAGFHDEVKSVLKQMDEIAERMGDEGVFRRCRDRLRSALAREEQGNEH